MRRTDASGWRRSRTASSSQNARGSLRPGADERERHCDGPVVSRYAGAGTGVAKGRVARWPAPRPPRRCAPSRASLACAGRRWRCPSRPACPPTPACRRRCSCRRSAMVSAAATPSLSGPRRQRPPLRRAAGHHVDRGRSRGGRTRSAPVSIGVCVRRTSSSSAASAAMRDTAPLNTMASGSSSTASSSGRTVGDDVPVAFEVRLPRRVLEIHRLEDDLPAVAAGRTRPPCRRGTRASTRARPWRAARQRAATQGAAVPGLHGRPVVQDQHDLLGQLARDEDGEVVAPAGHDDHVDACRRGPRGRRRGSQAGCGPSNRAASRRGRARSGGPCLARRRLSPASAQDHQAAPASLVVCLPRLRRGGRLEGLGELDSGASCFRPSRLPVRPARWRP